MGISLRPQHLRRYRDIAVVLWRYGRSDLVKNAGLEEALVEEKLPEDESAPEAKELAKDLEKLGPTFVKLGQVLSTRADLLPPPYLEALTRLQDDVEPIPFEDVRRVVEEELGRPLQDAFVEFELEPLASASLGQVHRARLPDGRPVAVKVQRPGVRERIAEDLEVLAEVAEFLDKHTKAGRRYGFQGIVEEFRRTLVSELDYRSEAQNLLTLGRNLAKFERIVVPMPVDAYTTQRVLTMDYVRGRKVTPLALLGRREDGRELADQLFQAYLEQVLVDGFFHADPHPGNVFLTEDGRIALIDLGMVARVAPGMQDKLLQWLLAISEGRGEDAGEVGLKIGDPLEHFDEAEYRRRTTDLVVRNYGAQLEQIEVGRIVLDATRISGECGIRVPQELTMLGKALLNLDHVGRVLDPTFDPNAAVRRHAGDILRRRMLKNASAGNFLSTLIEMKEFGEKLPGRLNKIMDRVANNDLQLKVDAIDEHRLIEGLQKIANRITMGLVLAALIVAAAMLMRVETSFRLFGYPGFAIVLFLLAAGGGIALVLSIALHDEKSRPGGAQRGP